MTDWTYIDIRAIEDVFPYWSTSLLSEAIARTDSEVEHKASALHLSKSGSRCRNPLHFWVYWQSYVEEVLLPSFPPSEWSRAGSFVLRPGFKPFPRGRPLGGWDDTSGCYCAFTQVCQATRRPLCAKVTLGSLLTDFHMRERGRDGYSAKAQPYALPHSAGTG